MRNIKHVETLHLKHIETIVFRSKLNPACNVAPNICLQLPGALEGSMDLMVSMCLSCYRSMVL